MYLKSVTNSVEQSTYKKWDFSDVFSYYCTVSSVVSSPSLLNCMLSQIYILLLHWFPKLKQVTEFYFLNIPARCEGTSSV